MSYNSFGNLFRFTSYGESHGPAIGCVVDGVPPNISLNEKDIQKLLDRRKPGQSKFVSQGKKVIKSKFFQVFLKVKQLVILLH